MTIKKQEYQKVLILMSPHVVLIRRTSVHLTVINAVERLDSSLSHFIEVRCSSQHVPDTAALNPWLQGHCRPQGALQQLADRRGLLSFRLQAAGWRRGAGRRETRPSGNPALHPSSWTRTFLLFIRPHVTRRVALRRFSPVQPRLPTLISDVTS